MLKCIPRSIVSLVEKQARGPYQQALLRGCESWSGSTLKGAARKWGSRYNESRGSLVCRIREALVKRGWRGCSTPLVKINNRWRRALVLVGPNGGKFFWG